MKIFSDIKHNKKGIQGMFLSSFPTDLRNVTIEMSHVTNS